MRQFLVYPSPRHPVQIVHEQLLAVARQMKFGKSCVVHLRDDRTDLFGRVVNAAEAGMRIARVTAKIVRRRLFQHHHMFGAGLTGGNGGFERGAAAAHDDNVTILGTANV